MATPLPFSAPPAGSRGRRVVMAGLFVAFYVGAVWVGQRLVNPLTHATPIWPAAGLALAAGLFRGWRPLWPALLLAVAGSSWAFNPVGPVARVGAVAGDVLGPLLGTWLTERLARGRHFSERPGDVPGFVLAGAGVMGAVSAACGALGLGLGGDLSWGDATRAWPAWCMSDVVAAAVFAPALLAWAEPAHRHDGVGPGGWRRAPEAVALALTAVFSTQAIFGGWPFPPHHHALEYLCGPALLWAAFRFPHRGVVTVMAALGTLGVVNSLAGLGPFAAPLESAGGEPLRFLQFFLVGVSGMALATAAGVRERRTQAAALEETVVRRTGEIRAELAERVRAERAAEESRVTLRQVIDLLPQAVWWKDRAGVYRGGNQLAAESVGLSTPAELVGRTDADLPGGAGPGEARRDADERVMATGETELRRVSHQSLPEAHDVTLETSKVPLRDATGQIVGVLGTAKDITAWEDHAADLRAARADLEARVAERTAALARVNERLQAGEERFRRAILDAPIPIMLHAEDGEILAVNHAWTTLSGYRHEHIPTIHHWIERAFPPQQREVRRNIIRELHHLERATERGEAVILTLDGGQRVWDFSSAPLGGLPDGRRLVISSAKDVTARRASEDALRESERRLRLALHAGAMGFWRIDMVALRAEWDEQVQRLNGWKPGTFPGTFEAFLGRVHPDDRPALRDIGRSMDGSPREFTVQFRVTWPDGSEHWLEDRGTPDVNAGGTIIALTGTTMDITERRHAEDAMRAAKAEAERANAAKSEFLSRMSHELRTPLNAILGFGQLLELASLAPRDVQSVEHILRAGRHLLGLIDEVLDISRIESGQLTLCFEPVHAGELMAEAVNLLRPLAARHDIRVRPGGWNHPGPATAPGASSAHVLADRQRLKQVLLNLLSNAIKYNKSGGEVLVACHPSPGRRLSLEVRDTGRGFAPGDLARLFTPFERFGVERDGIEGTGIGLVIARRLVESMGGRITVESAPGVGSTFRVELACTTPLTDPAGNVAVPPTPDDFRDDAAASLSAESLFPFPPRNAAARTVLYIEDNLSNLQLIERVFERRLDRQRVALISAMQGGLGLDLARQHRPDLILLDLQLPDIPGEEVLARLRAEPATRDIPVIILSADATDRQRENLLGAGALAYLTKPLDVPGFLTLVSRTLESCPA